MKGRPDLSRNFTVPPTGLTAAQLDQVKTQALNAKKACLCCRQQAGEAAAFINNAIENFLDVVREVYTAEAVQAISQALGSRTLQFPRTVRLRLGITRAEQIDYNGIWSAAATQVRGRFVPVDQDVITFDDPDEFQQSAAIAFRNTVGKDQLRARSQCEQCVLEARWRQDRKQKVVFAKLSRRISSFQKPKPKLPGIPEPGSDPERP